MDYFNILWWFIRSSDFSILGVVGIVTWCHVIMAIHGCGLGPLSGMVVIFPHLNSHWNSELMYLLFSWHQLQYKLTFFYRGDSIFSSYIYLMNQFFFMLAMIAYDLTLILMLTDIYEWRCFLNSNGTLYPI